jgi:hypothetical protein
MFDEKERECIFNVEKEDDEVELVFKKQEVQNLISLLMASNSIFEESAKLLSSQTSEGSVAIKNKYLDLAYIAEKTYYKIYLQYDKDMPSKSDIIN